MTDNVFQLETAAIAHRAYFLHDCGILLTDFSFANPSVDHGWIFEVQQRAGIRFGISSIASVKRLSPALGMLARSGPALP